MSAVNRVSRGTAVSAAGDFASVLYCMAAATAGMPMSPYRLCRLASVCRGRWAFSVLVDFIIRSVAVFLILPAALILLDARASPPHPRDDLSLGVVASEWGRNAQEIVSYRDIRPPRRRGRQRPGIWLTRYLKSDGSRDFAADVSHFSTGAAHSATFLPQVADTMTPAGPKP